MPRIPPTRPPFPRNSPPPRGAVVAVLVAVATAANMREAAVARTEPSATATASAPTIRQVTLKSDGFYWIRHPAGWSPGDEPPLVICLHGTDDRAEDAISFWSALRPDFPAIWVAPQASGRGWSEADLPRLRETWADLRQRSTFDAGRVLVAGFSAGGAMAFHWLYVESFPATAVATLANYVPPPVKPEDVRRHKHVPVYYGVGMADINQNRMLAGLSMLRDNGVHVTVYRPFIGHTLSPEVGRQAIAWFERLCRDETRRRIERAAAEADGGRQGPAAAGLERIIAQKRWHHPDDLLAAEESWAKITEAGRRKIREAQSMMTVGGGVEAVTALRQVEDAYSGSALASEARELRERLEQDPRVRQQLAEQERQRREKEAKDLFLHMQRLLAAGRFEDARKTCQTIVGIYGDTSLADRARGLLEKIPRRNAP